MSALINRVKDHISDNRGKYGAAAGAGAMYGASKIDSPLVNQAGFNILANGQNLALDTAAKIDPRATTALNDLGMNKIRPEDIDASNALYNSGVSKYINPNPVDMVNANERSTEAYNKAMAMKANAEDTLVNAKNQGQDYLDQGINYVKGLNPFSESTIKIPVKSMLLEGYQPEEITEGIVRDTDYSKFKKEANLNYKINDINQFDKTINDLPEDSRFRESFLKAKEYRNNQNAINQNAINLDLRKKENLRKILNNEAKNKTMNYISRRLNPKRLDPTGTAVIGALGGTIGGTLGYIGDSLNNENSGNPLLDKDSNIDGSLIGMGMGAISPIALVAKGAINERKYIKSDLKRDYKNIRKHGKTKD